VRHDRVALTGEDGIYRSRVIMGRHGFGRRRVQIFFLSACPTRSRRCAHPLYPALADVANRWNAQMGIDQRFPADHAAYLEHCTRPSGKATPAAAEYGEADFNCLHQDVYGDWCSRCRSRSCSRGRGEDFTGGEFVLTEHAPRIAVTRRGRGCARARA